MNGQKLRNLCRGKVVPIKFNKNIEIAECRFEEGMKAYIVGVSEPDKLGLIIIKVEERDFKEYNKSIEKPNWLNSTTNEYDLRFSDTTKVVDWNGKDTVYEDEELIVNFEFIEEEMNELMKQYQNENSNKTYVEWLESKLLDSRKTI